MKRDKITPGVLIDPSGERRILLKAMSGSGFLFFLFIIPGEGFLKGSYALSKSFAELREFSGTEDN
jgi:hypothetical protein